MARNKDGYEIWIEAEEWSAGQWNPVDANTDVIVHRNDGSHWVASFFSYKISKR